MKGDFSRLGFGPERRSPATRVLMQQGRVQLDADFNEQGEIAERLRRTGLAMLAGQAGAPVGGGGLAVSVTASGLDLAVRGGSYLVDGLLCTLPDTTVRTQPDLGGADPFGLEPPAAPPPGRYLVYLDRWDRHVTAQEDSALAEPALGGPDTTTRLRQVNQVKLAAVDAVAGAEAFGPDWTPLPAGARGALAAIVTAPDLAQSPCYLPPQAGYTALTNQLYRVEVHDGGTLPPGAGPAPTWKWSRDNGAVATRVTGMSGAEVMVADLGPSDALGFAPQQVVELCTLADELAGRPGPLGVIAAVAAETRTLTLAGALPAGDGDARVRRWDQPGAALPMTGEPAVLEQGLSVRFAPGRYRTGDWWTIPARTAIDADTGSILWPPDAFLPAEGIAHAYAPLALVDLDGQGMFTLVEDCRTPLVPLGGRIPLRARYHLGQALVPLASGTTVSRDAVMQGLVLATPAALDPASLRPGVVDLLVEAPVPLSSIIPGNTDATVVGTRTLALDSYVNPLAPGLVAVQPSYAAMELVDALLAQPFRTVSPSDALLFHSLAAYDRPPKWVANADGSLSQTVLNAGATPVPGDGFDPDTPFPILAMTKTPVSSSPATGLLPRDTLAHVGVTVSLDSGVYGDAGLLFAYQDLTDFWTFYVSRFGRRLAETAGTDVLAAVLTRFVKGYPAQQAKVDLAMGGTVWTADTLFDLDIVQGGQGPVFGVVWRTKADGRRLAQQTLDFGGAHPNGSLGSVGAAGLMTRNQAATFSRYVRTRQTGESLGTLPFGGSPPLRLRLVAKRAQMQVVGEPRTQTQPAEPPFEIAFQIQPPGDGGAGARVGYAAPPAAYAAKLRTGYAGHAPGIGTGWL